MFVKQLYSGFSILRLYLHTTCGAHSKQQVKNAVKKIFSGTKRSKKFHYSDAPVLPSPNSFSKGSIEGKPSGNARRATVLNKLFMRHITDQMATGEYASEILGNGIEISRVKMNADYKIVNVYWLAKGTADDNKIEKILRRTSGFLRHELSQLRIMGNVPIIQFVKDKHYAHTTELDNRLKMADFGDDYTPRDPSAHLRSELQICAPLEKDIRIRIEKIEAENSIAEETNDLPLPLMPQNVLGLNHADILERVKKMMKKSEAIHRKSSTGFKEDNWASFKINQTVNEDPIILGSERHQREMFKDFLQKRQILRYKARREKNYTPDGEYIKEELRERHLQSLDRFNLLDNQGDDYLDDEIEEPNKEY